MSTLLIRPGAIGDCIASLPVLEHVATLDTEIWVPSSVVTLVQFGKQVRSIASTGLDLLGIGDRPVPEPLIKALRGFDSVLSWYGTNREEFREAVAKLNLPFTFHRALPPASNTLHVTDFLAGQIQAPNGLVPRIDVGTGQTRDTIVIHPFSGGMRKNWPIERFQELAAGCPIAVEWSAGPEEFLAGATRFDDLIELAAWIRGARLYIGNDSGVTHLAAAVGVPVIALFSVTNPEVWAPRGKAVRVMRSGPSCDFSVRAILAEVRSLLEAFPGASGQWASAPP